jgi:inosine-uridine nucleoside N-ribohydrolase
MKRVIIDTDPGIGVPGADIDDGLAIILALKSPELSVEVLTIVNGNVGMEEGTANALRILELMGASHIPVAKGMAKPLLREMAPVREAFNQVLSKGKRLSEVGSEQETPTLSSLPEHAVDLLVSRVMSAPGEITVIAIGPLTNVAMAMLKEPRFAENLKELIVMGGAATVLAQNMTTVAEFNMYTDPEAAKIVLHSGAPITMVGLDVTMQVFLTREHLAKIAQYKTPLTEYIVSRAEPWIDFLGVAFPKWPEYQNGCALHDPLAIGVVLDPSLVRTERAYVDVETGSDLTRGQTVADRGLAIMPPSQEPNVNICVEVDTERFMELFISRVVT